MGNHVWKLLKNVDGLEKAVLKVYEGDATTQAHANTVLSRHMPAWRTIAKVFSLAKPAEVLSSEQLAELAIAGPEFGLAFRAAYGVDQHISLKVHLIETHLVEFALRWHSTGLFSEDAAESIHALTNRLARRYACIRGNERKLRLMNIALQVQQNNEIIKASQQFAARRARGKRPRT